MSDRTFTSVKGGSSAAVHAPMIVGGASWSAARGLRYQVLNPATGAVVGSAPLGGTLDAERAVATARRALAGWRALSVEARATRLDGALDAVAARAASLAMLLTREQGKPLDESAAEIDGFITRMRSIARIARSAPGGDVFTFSASRNAFERVATTPGVSIALVAWNFPIGLLAKKLGPWLAGGSTAVVKPAFTTPLATLLLVDAMNAGGLPDGVLNCVSGRGSDVGAALLAQPGLARVLLTGGDATGRAVAAATRRRQVAVELGLAGSDPMIVCGDADLRAAAAAADEGRFRNAGQACTAVKRLYVASEVFDEFTALLCAAVRRRRPGDGLVPEAAPLRRLGPLHTRELRGTVEAQLADAVERGANVLVGGGRPESGPMRHGHYLEPTVVENVPAASRLLTEEVFGPVLPVVRTRSLTDAIQRANQSRWHLNASIWTADLPRARGSVDRIRAGRVWINRLPFGHEPAPARAAGAIES